MHCHIRALADFITNIQQLLIFGLGQGESIEDDETFYSEQFNYDLRISNFLRWPFKSQYTADQLKKKVQAASCLQKPKSVGTVSLKSADPFDKPVIDPKYLSHPDDISSLLEGYVCTLHSFNRVMMECPTVYLL